MEIMSTYVNKYAIVDDGAEVGEGTKVWHWSHICSGAKIGRHCNIGQNVYVESGVVIGDGVKIKNNVSIYSNVVIEDDVFCGPSMVFTNVINPRACVERKSEFMNTFVKKGATLGANCTIVCGVSIGEYAFVGAGSVITKDVPPYALIFGNPGVVKGWMSRRGNKLTFNDGIAVDDEDGSCYRLYDGEKRCICVE